jgi:hypothetical protein
VTSSVGRLLLPRLWGAAALLGLGAACWFGLGMNRGLLLSSDVKSRCWPWAPGYPRTELQAPLLTDPVWQFVPWLEFARRELQAGRLPLWNPHQNGGVPLLGNAQSAVASPLAAPALLFGVQWGWNLTLLLRVLTAALGTFLWLRDLGRSRIAASLGAAMYSLSGPFVGWLEHPQTLAAAPVPFVLLFAGRLARRASPGPLVGLAFATAAVLLGGHPETAIMAALVATGFAAATANGRRGALWASGGASLGLLLSAPAVLPFVEYFFASAASHGAGRQPFVLPLSALVRFFVPHAPVGHPIEAAATVSAVGLCLAVGGALTKGEKSLRSVSLGLACLLLLLAYDNPLARLAAWHTPIYWSRVLILLPLPLGFLAATGLDTLRGLAGPRVGERGATLMAVVLVLAAGGELLSAARGVHAVTHREDVDRTTPLLRRLASESEPFRILPLHTFLPPDSATAIGLDDVRGYDAITPRAWLRERGAMGRFTGTSYVTDVLEPWNLAPGGRALDLWNVKYLLLHPQLPYTAERLNRDFGLDLEEAYLGEDGRLLRNRRALPRVRLAGEGTVILRARDATRWRLEVDVPTETTLVLANPMFPGWRARVDGTRAPIASQTGTPVEIRVPAGRHTVDVRYEPLSFRLGIGMCLAALVVLGATIWRGRLRRSGFEGESEPGSPAG